MVAVESKKKVKKNYFLQLNTNNYHLCLKPLKKIKKVPEGDCVKLGAFQRVPEGHRVVVAATNDLVDRDKNKFLGKFCFSSL
jgi:hypothetical protein